MKSLLLLTFTLSSYFLFSQTWVNKDGTMKLIKNGSSVTIKWQNEYNEVITEKMTCNNFPSFGQKINLNCSDGDYFVLERIEGAFTFDKDTVHVRLYNELGTPYWSWDTRQYLFKEIK
jgi:hypothetical protein